MANAATLTDLQNRALDFADMTGSGFPVTARLTDYINDGLVEIHELCAMHDYLRSSDAITLVAGTEEYSLPSDFYKASSVWHVVNSRRHEIHRFTLAQLDGHKTTGPSAAGSVQLWYVPQITKLSAGGDTVEVALPIGWETFAALHAAIQLKNREQTDAQPLLLERDRVKQRIIGHIEPRDQMPDQIEDHYDRWGYGARDNERGTSLRYRILGNKIHIVELWE